MAEHRDQPRIEDFVPSTVNHSDDILGELEPTDQDPQQRHPAVANKYVQNHEPECHDGRERLDVASPSPLRASFGAPGNPQVGFGSAVDNDRTVGDVCDEKRHDKADRATDAERDRRDEPMDVADAKGGEQNESGESECTRQFDPLAEPSGRVVDPLEAEFRTASRKHEQPDSEARVDDPDRAIERASKELLQWRGDYTNSPDAE